jgi:tetratricopeptide (TPR) repeat protein/2-polyprenyl-3-methyl-5-hydroxy-6-metoxy-1,4-benzoquinol methylase
MAEPNGDGRTDDLFARAMREHQEGRLDAAEALYREILAIDPRQLDSLHFLGAIAHQRGRHADAVDLIGQAIAGNDRIAAYHASIGAAHGALGERDKAIAHYRKAAELDPGDWAVQNNLSHMLRAAGDLEGTERHFERAVALKPELAAELVDTAAAYLTQGRPNEALEAVARALVARDDPDARVLFVQCVRSADRLPAVPGFRALMIRALREAWARPVSLTGPAIALITNQPPVTAAIRAAMMSWPRRLSPSETGAAVGVLAQDELLHAVLDHALVNHAGLERLLTSVRTILLDAAVHARSEVSREMIGFSCALARQCFINEYVFDVSDTERQALAWLRTSVRTALAGRAPVFAIHLIALACYAPLHTLERDRGLLDRRWLKPLDALITEQLREPQAEAALRAAMPRLTGITDPVSAEVRQQYEENPYPRWVAVAPTPPENSVLDHLRSLFPSGPLQDLREPDTLDILVAGCGTGQQPIGTAQRFPRARVLAIDLSLASLAYAKRKSDAAGVTIEYGQADILELELDRRFEIVESSGVLHHLADPMRGWATLTALVKPGGFMRIGLYSELGRSNVVALRAMIAERGFKATPEDIRRARQEMISGQAARFASILHSPDFFSTSACRDLLFHVQEHRLTLPQIGAFLAEHDLRLLGFELDAPTVANYRAAFPDDTTLTDLALWHRFETANPDTFRGMYNFWAWRPA